MSNRVAARARATLLLLLLLALAPLSCDETTPRGVALPRADATSPAVSAPMGPAAPKPVPGPSATADESASPDRSQAPSAASPSSTDAAVAPPESVTPDRAQIVVPPSIGKAEDRRPFVLLLHGYQGNGRSIAKHFGLVDLGVERRWLWAAPDGAEDSKRRRFWNAGSSCCDFERSGVDHLAQLGRLIERARAHPRVDPAKIVVVGYSNGGFMAHRLGCELEGIAAVGSIAGSPPADVTRCRATPPVVIQVHGDADEVVRFGGGNVLDRDDVTAQPGPVAGLAGWAKRAGCPPAAKPAGTLDLEPKIDGEETERLRFGPCASTIELWRVPGVGHDVASNRGAFVLLMAALLGEKP